MITDKTLDDICHLSAGSIEDRVIPSDLCLRVIVPTVTIFNIWSTI